MKTSARPRWAYLLTALGLSLVAILFLLLYGGAFPVTRTEPPPSSTPAPTITEPSRARVDGLRDSGPAANPQEGQDGRPQAVDH